MDLRKVEAWTNGAGRYYPTYESARRETAIAELTDFLSRSTAPTDLQSDNALALFLLKNRLAIVPLLAAIDQPEPPA